jgi:hypothetical protein
MKKLFLFLALFCFYFFVNAQQGVLTCYQNPTNPNGSGGDIAAKIIANYKLYVIDRTAYLDIEWNIKPTDYLFWDGKKYTIQQLGANVFSELSISRNIACIADAFYEGRKLCDVIFDASGCASPNSYSKNPIMNCTKQPIDTDDKVGIAIWKSGKVSFQNLRIKDGLVSIYNPYPMVPNAIKAAQGNSSSVQQPNKQAGNNSISSNSSNANSKVNTKNSSGSSTASVSKSPTEPKTTSNNLQKNNEIINSSKNIVQISKDASNQVTQIVNSYYGSLSQQKARREQLERKEEEQYKKEQEYKEKERRDFENKLKEGFIKSSSEYNNSDFKVHENIVNALVSDNTRFKDWVDACKTGTKESLEKYISKYRKDYFAIDVAPEMINGWKYGKANPTPFIKTAIFENNWVLTKYLLDNGANPDFQMQDAYGNCYNPILQLLCPKYSPARELAYVSEDKFELLKKMILQGANANAISKQNTDERTDYLNSSNVCNERVIYEILCRDYKGTMLKWLLDNKKLNTESINSAMAYLLFMYQDISYGHYSTYKKELYKEYPSYFKLTPAKDDVIPANEGGITVADNILIQMKILVQHKAQMSGSLLVGVWAMKCFTKPFDINQIPFFCTWKVPEIQFAHREIWIDLQKSILSRFAEIDREYIRKLIASIITKTFPSNESITNLIDIIIDNKIIEPKSKELFFNKKYYNMLSLSKDEGGSSWVQYLKNKK